MLQIHGSDEKAKRQMNFLDDPKKSFLSMLLFFIIIIPFSNDVQKKLIILINLLNERRKAADPSKISYKILDYEQALDLPFGDFYIFDKTGTLVEPRSINDNFEDFENGGGSSESRGNKEALMEILDIYNNDFIKYDPLNEPSSTLESCESDQEKNMNNGTHNFRNISEAIMYTCEDSLEMKCVKELLWKNEPISVNKSCKKVFSKKGSNLSLSQVNNMKYILYGEIDDFKGLEINPIEITKIKEIIEISGGYEHQCFFSIEFPSNEIPSNVDQISYDKLKEYTFTFIGLKKYNVKIHINVIKDIL